MIEFHQSVPREFGDQRQQVLFAARRFDRVFGQNQIAYLEQSVALPEQSPYARAHFIQAVIDSGLEIQDGQLAAQVTWRIV